MANLYNNLTALPLDVEKVYQSLNGADMTWVLVATILVFIMTPANGYFYGGTVYVSAPYCFSMFISYT